MTSLHLVGDDGDTELDAIRRSTDLHQLETIVRKGLRAGVEALEGAEALLTIHEGKLWSLMVSTWAGYCTHLGITPQRAHQLCAWARINRVDPTVPTERVARELTRVSDEEVREVLRDAIEAAGGETPSATQVRAVVDERLGVERRSDGKAKAPGLQVRRTPRWLFDELDERFGPFMLDAYASPDNALCEGFRTIETDGNAGDWLDVTFGNPEFRDITPPLEQAVRQAERDIRSVILGPVGCSQAWYHELAIRGTVYVPDRRINFDLPDGSPTDGADRDTIVMAFGGEHTNERWREGEFRVQRLELRGPQA